MSKLVDNERLAKLAKALDGRAKAGDAANADAIAQEVTDRKAAIAQEAEDRDAAIFSNALGSNADFNVP